MLIVDGNLLVTMENGMGNEDVMMPITRYIHTYFQPSSTRPKYRIRISPYRPTVIKATASKAMVVCSRH
jgi:hypothetical protein